MSSHDSFYRTIKEAGGILDPSTQPSPYDFLSSISKSILGEIKDGINNKSDILWPLGDIRHEIVSNQNFNAFAHQENGQEGIAVFSGLFYLLFDLSSTLWSHSAFLTRTHPTNNNAKEINICKERVGLLQKSLIWEGPMGVYTTDKERIFRAFNTTVTAYSFICLHEVGHLVKAHIPYLQAKTKVNFSTLFECNIDLFISNSNTIQKLETDADKYASRTLIDLALTTWNMGHTFPLDFSINRDELPLYILDILIGFSLAFFCMDIASCNSKLQSNSTHPSPAIRLATSFISMSELLEHPFKISIKEGIKLFYIAFQEIRDFWSILELPARTLDNDIDKIFERSYELLENINTLDDELRKPMDIRLHRLGTSYSHYDQFSDFYKKK